MKMSRQRHATVRVGTVVMLTAMLTGGAALVSSPTAMAAPGDTRRVSVDSSGGQANDHSFDPSISPDGRFVAFHSAASNLVSGDTNSNDDVFVKNMITGATHRVSVDSAGGQADGDSGFPAISMSGRYTAFQSSAWNLVADDVNRNSDVFVHDAATGATRLVSVDSAGAQGNSASFDTTISADGRYIAFNSLASNLVPGDTNNESDVFVHDTMTGATRRVNVDSSGLQANSVSFNPAISADGRHVTFSSFSSNLVNGDTNNVTDVFIHDTMTGATRRVSVDSNGAQGSSGSFEPGASSDGRFVTFTSQSNLVPGDTNNTRDVFVHDTMTGATRRVNVDSSGLQADSVSFDPAISTGGRHVAFTSSASNLVADDTNGRPDVFVHDIVAGATRRVSVDSSGGQAENDGGHNSAISGDGRSVAFVSFASNLAPDDTNGLFDVFVHQIGDQTPPAIALNTPANDTDYLLGSAQAADYTCTDEPAGSGVALCDGDVPDGAALDTATVGSRTFTVAAADNAGNAASVTHNWRVIFDFGGFYSPLENSPVVNVARAGQSIPVVFSLGGDQGLAVLDGPPTSQRVSCDASAPTGMADETATPGSSGLSYHPSSENYTYVWRTSKEWADSCRLLRVGLVDGTTHTAQFRFR